MTFCNYTNVNPRLAIPKFYYRPIERLAMRSTHVPLHQSTNTKLSQILFHGQKLQFNYVLCRNQDSNSTQMCFNNRPIVNTIVHMNLGFLRVGGRKLQKGGKIFPANRILSLSMVSGDRLAHYGWRRTNVCSLMALYSAPVDRLGHADDFLALFGAQNVWICLRSLTKVVDLGVFYTWP